MSSTLTPLSVDLATMKRILARRFRPGATVYIDLIRPELEAAQINPSHYGGLLAAACERGWLRATEQSVTSRHPAAKGRRVVVYKRRAMR